MMALSSEADELPGEEAGALALEDGEEGEETSLGHEGMLVAGEGEAPERMEEASPPQGSALVPPVEDPQPKPEIIDIEDECEAVLPKKGWAHMQNLKERIAMLKPPGCTS